MTKVRILDGVPIQHAVADYMEGNPDPLIELFKQGVPLHEFPEAVEIVSNSIAGTSSRPKGRPPKTRKASAKEDGAVQFAAQLHGMGLGLISKGNNSKPTACGIAGSLYHENPQTIYDAYKRRESEPILKYQYEVGKNTPKEKAKEWINQLIEDISK